MIERLGGGQRQSIGVSNAVAGEIRKAPARASELWEAIAAPSAIVRFRAVDALEKVSATHPEVLVGHELEILDEFSGSELTEVRWHAGLLIPRLHLEAEQLSRAVEVLERLLEDSSRIVQANALEGLVLLADAHPEFAGHADAAMNRAPRSPHASVRARVRRLTR